MTRDSAIYQAYLEILNEELVPAMGCTEPIAIAYAAALARRTLGALPEAVQVSVSGNLIKNAKSVVVPHTGGLRGIPAAAAAGIVAGRAEAELEVLSEITAQQTEQIKQFLERVPCSVSRLETPEVFEIQVVLTRKGDEASVQIVGNHTNVTKIVHNGTVLHCKACPQAQEAPKKTDRSLLTVEKIYEFANSVDLADVRFVIGRQIAYNWAIAEEGMRGDYGAGVGKVLKRAYGDSLHNRARYMAAAASDARMNGCELPVVINSGSGNQGITVSVPVITYARVRKDSEERLYRALVLSNLCSIHQKTGIGTLSAYCGAVSAGAGAAAGIAYLCGGSLEDINHTLVNAVAIDSGMICDGAKPSCAAKIATAVDAGLLGYHMWCSGSQFYAGDGIIKKGIENNIRMIGNLAQNGMVVTDREIIRIMTEE